MRDIVVGSHSDVWRKLAPRLVLRGRHITAIGHREMPTFPFTRDDRVWVLSFSRSPAENAALIAALRGRDVKQIVYVSSSSTIVSEQTDCYEYPRAKAQAEKAALAAPNARVLTIGLMHESVDELPAGACVSTRYDTLADFIASPDWGDDGSRRKLLFEVVHRPMRSVAERVAYRWYGRALRQCGAYPCLLRPADLLLRAFGVRWYGYVYLSNALWISTTS